MRTVREGSHRGNDTKLHHDAQQFQRQSSNERFYLHDYLPRH